MKKLVRESLEQPIVYRCGYCGNITDKNGEALYDEEWEKSKKILDKYGDKFTQKVNGECCKDDAANYYPEYE